YEALPFEERQRLHAAVGAALEEIHAGRLHSVCDQLAYQYGRSADSAKAIAYLPYLIQKAGETYPPINALATLDRSLEHAAALPESDQRDRLIVDLVARQGQALVKLGQLERARDLLLSHVAQIESLNNAQFAGPFFLILAEACSFLGDADAAAT